MEDYHFLIRYDYCRNFLCLSCRKSVVWPNLYQIASKNGDGDLLFKAFTRRITDAEQAYLKKFYFDVQPRCPVCTAVMFEVPLDYCVPSKRSRKWKRMEVFAKAKGYIRKEMPSSKKGLKELLVFEMERTKYRLEHLKRFKYKDESDLQTQYRLQSEIEKITQQIQKLDKRK